MPEEVKPACRRLSRLTFLTPAECAAAEPRGYIVKGLIAPRDVGCIFGPPGAGKSLIAPYIGYRIARGESAFGMRTRPGKVFYVAAEDPHGMRGRVAGLERRYGAGTNDFLLVGGVSDLLIKDSPDLAELREAVAEHKPALIFLDTLAISFPGLEENSAEGMGRVVDVARSLTRHGAAVVLIHHDTKTAGATPRGHSLLNGALDVTLQLAVRDEEGVIRGNLRKNRNGPCDRQFAFTIGTESLGQDDDGDEISVAVLCEADGAAPKRQKLSASEQAALIILTELCGLERRDVTEAEWRHACIDGPRVSASDARASRRKATNRAITTLARGGYIQTRGNYVLPCDDAFDAELDGIADTGTKRDMSGTRRDMSRWQNRRRTGTDRTNPLGMSCPVPAYDAQTSDMNSLVG